MADIKRSPSSNLRPRIFLKRKVSSQDQMGEMETSDAKTKRHKQLHLNSDFTSIIKEPVAPLKVLFKRRSMKKNNSVQTEAKLYPIFQSVPIKSRAVVSEKQNSLKNCKNPIRNHKIKILPIVSNKSCDVQSKNEQNSLDNDSNKRKLRTRKHIVYVEDECDFISDEEKKNYPLFESFQEKHKLSKRSLRQKSNVKNGINNTALQVSNRDKIKDFKADSLKRTKNYIKKKYKNNLSVTVSLPLEKLHPIFQSKQQEVISKGKMCKVLNKKLNCVKINKCNLNNISVIDLDEELNNESINSTEIISNSSVILNESSPVIRNSITYRNQEVMVQLIFPVVNHVNYLKSLHFDCNIKFLENPKCEQLFNTSWNNFIGLLNTQAIEYIKNENNNSCEKSEIFSCSRNSGYIDNGNVPTVYDTTWNNISLDVNKMIENPSIKTIKIWLEAWKQKCLKWSSSENATKNNYDSDYSDEDDELGKAIIIYGPPGTGKTSIVNALAANLGFTVLEVNVSSSRTGKQITSKLQEAFQSHRVQNTANFAFQQTDEKLLKNENCEIFVNRDTNSESLNCKRKCSKNNNLKSHKKQKDNDISDDDVLKCKNITNFFSKVNANKSIENEKNNKNSCIIQKHKAINNFFTKLNSSEKILQSNSKAKIINSVIFPKSKDKPVEKISVLEKNENITLILFDDVDVVFDEDEGFWCAVNSFLKTSKRPVVFTASRNLEIFSNNLNQNYEVINFDKINIDLDKELEQLSNTKLIKETFKELNVLNANDIRRTLLQLQFWDKQILRSCHNHMFSKPFLNSNFSNNPFYDIQTFSNEMNEILFQNWEDLHNIITYHYSLDFDVLHSNLFNIMLYKEQPVKELLWNSVYENYLNLGEMIKEEETEDKNPIKESTVLSNDKSINSIKNSCVSSLSHTELKSLVHMCDNFSFSDVLKSQLGHDKFLWMSTKERLKQWSSGLPVCVENDFPEMETTCLDVICTINLLSARNYHQPFQTKCNKDTAITISSFDNVHENLNLVQNNVNCILSVLPPIHHLYVRPLILDYLSFLRSMCKEEIKRKTTQLRNRRFLHYFDSISLLLDPSDFEF